MDTTSIGNSLETRIYDILQAEIEADRFFVRKSCCKLFKGKGYYSKDRCSDIIFDLAIEIYIPGANSYSMLVLFESKNYNHPVPVDDAEEFFAKVQQVGAANVKAVIASTASFQRGTLAFAKSKGMGLMRIFDNSQFKWELYRSPSAGAKATDTDITSTVNEALCNSDFTSNTYDLYMSTSSQGMNSLWNFFEDLMRDSSLTPEQFRRIANPQSKFIRCVPFLSEDEIEQQSIQTLSAIGYVEGMVSLNAICQIEQKQHGLNISSTVLPPNTDPKNLVLGSITFNPLHINIYLQQPENKGRERFTLAHELAHHLLKHGRYMLRETCNEDDLFVGQRGVADSTDFARLEFQANLFAAHLLMPRTNFTKDFWNIIQRLNIIDKGFGPLYVDNQPCNQRNYIAVTSSLMQRYGVSPSAVTIRLKELGVLQDARDSFLPCRNYSELGATRLACQDHL